MNSPPFPMFSFPYPVPQSDPPRSPRETLPTMYDLPSEYLEEPGLPDEFHDLQPQLLTFTFKPRNYLASQVFCGSDMNLYYDVRHPRWYKRPDWFGVVGVPRLYDEVEMRLSYVIWQEGITPFILVELLSPGTEKEDLGEGGEENLPTGNLSPNGQAIDPIINDNKPPKKWEVYEQILRVPYYVVFSRYTNQIRAFKLSGSRYEELELPESKLWIPELELGLGLWQGEYLGVTRLWLRWYDFPGNWIPTEAEQERAEKLQALQQIEQERQRAEQAEFQLSSLVQKLRQAGLDPDAFLKGQD